MLWNRGLPTQNWSGGYGEVDVGHAAQFVFGFTRNPLLGDANSRFAQTFSLTKTNRLS